MRWRRQLIFLHRDVGFLCLGMTLVYAVSGIATNHRQHWDYNTTSETRVEQVGTPAELLSIDEGDGAAAVADAERDRLTRRLVEILDRDEPPRRVFWRGRDRLSLFFAAGDRDTVDYHPSTGTIEHTVREDRFLFRQLNFLHLNESHGFWTWIADLYALALCFLALTGVLIVKGPKGLRGRGKWMVLTGAAIPLIALWLLR